MCRCVGLVYLRTCGNSLECFNVGVLCSEEMGFRITCPSETVFIVCLSSSEQFSSCYRGCVHFSSLRNEAGLNTQIFTELMLRFKHVATRDSRLYGCMNEDSGYSSGMWVCVIRRGRSGLAHPATQRLSQTI